MKRKLITMCMLACAATAAQAKDGYRVQLKFKDVKDSMIYMAHYFAQPQPVIYKNDSVRVDKNGNAVMSSTKKITGGMYGIMLSDQSTYIELLLNNGDDITMTVGDLKDLPKSLSFKNSPENDEYRTYGLFAKELGEKHRKLTEDLAKAKNSADSASIKAQMTATMKTLTTYRKDYAKAHPDRMMAKIFNALEGVEAPEGTHYLADGKTVDSTYAYRYLKAHYWDNFDLKDGRMINTPLYEERLKNYFDRWVTPVPDSAIADADWVLAQTRGTGELFNYTLSFFSNYGQNSRIMGMDKMYVHIVKEYYMKGDATWMSNDLLEKHIKRMNEIEPNLIGNLGYDITMKDTSGKKDVTVSQIKSKYKLLVIWEPTCGHCMKEIPLVDSVYRAAKLKERGVTVIGVCSEVNEKAWKEFIAKHELGDWVNIYDPEHRSLFHSKYDVYATPTMYMLNEKGIIIGKHIDHSNIASLVDMLEHQEADKKKM